MILRRLREAALYAGFGFLSDVAATRFCLAVANRWKLQALFCNLAVMVLSVCFVRKAKSTYIMAAWILGNLAGCWVAMSW